MIRHKRYSANCDRPDFLNEPLAKVEVTPLNPPDAGGKKLAPSPCRGGGGGGVGFYGFMQEV